jgi:hypothetical protein
MLEVYSVIPGLLALRSLVRRPNPESSFGHLYIVIRISCSMLYATRITKYEPRAKPVLSAIEGSNEIPTTNGEIAAKTGKLLQFGHLA